MIGSNILTQATRRSSLGQATRRCDHRWGSSECLHHRRLPRTSPDGGRRDQLQPHRSERLPRVRNHGLQYSRLGDQCPRACLRARARVASSTLAIPGGSPIGSLGAISRSRTCFGPYSPRPDWFVLGHDRSRCAWQASGADCTRLRDGHNDRREKGGTVRGRGGFPSMR